MSTLTVYHTADCHLCEEALKVVEVVRRRHPFELRLVDIAEDGEVYRRYREAIPVICVDGREIARYRLDPETLTAALTL